MNEAALAAMLAAALANTGLLTGIFFRLGGVMRGLDDHARRIENLEAK